MSTDNKVSTAELLFARAELMGLQPFWLTRKGLFVVTTDIGEQYIHLAQSMLNSQVSASLVRNKYLTRLILERHKLPNIPFAHPQTISESQEFLDKHHKIVVKPLRGSGARDIHIAETINDIASLNFSKYIFEKHIAGKEMRYLVLDGEVVAVYQSDYGVSVKATRSMQCTAFPKEVWDPKLTVMSAQIADIFGLQFAAIDYLIDSRGQAYILEVNSTPDLKWFHAPSAGPSVDVAQLFLQSMLTSRVDNFPQVVYTN